MELLSPAGNLSSAYAAFIGGADAIYIGGKSFSARASADNFSNEEIREIVFYAHSINRKVYVTLNTLLFQDEFFQAVEFAQFLYSIDIDGIIIQDLGLANYLHKTLPNLPLNASTQLNCHNIKQAEALIKVGFKRIVLAREANTAFIKQVKDLGVEVEVFAHGALCVSYSGNCLMSSFIGDRSGNRGRCAQPCRMKYNLVEDGKMVSYDTFSISTKDLMTINRVQELISLGVDSLKLEGRLKSEEYIYAVSRAYRHAIDRLDVKQDKTDLIKIFNRKFTEGYAFDESPFKLLNTDTSSHQGEVVGQVVDTYKNRVAIKLTKDISRLDGIRFNGKEQFGLSIEKMFLNRNPVEFAKAGSIIELSGIENPNRLKDLEVIRTKDYKLTKQIQESLKQALKVNVRAAFDAHMDKPIKFAVMYNGIRVEAYGNAPEVPQGSGTTKERIEAQLRKSGDYPYSISKLNINVDQCFIPISEINKVRNEAFTKLKEALIKTNEVLPLEYENKSYGKLTTGGVRAIVENPTQDEVLQRFGVLSYSYFDNEYHNELRVSKEKAFNHQNELMHFFIEKDNDGELIASCYTNITNSYALDCFYEFGFDQCILSPELNKDSIAMLLKDYRIRHGETPNVGIVSYGKLDMMIMKSCPIGTFYNNKGLHCNRCHDKEYELEDRIGARYHLLGDANCNTRILSDKPLCLFDKNDELEELGLTQYLLFTDENENEVTTVINAYYDNSVPSFKTNKGHYNKRPL